MMKKITKLTKTLLVAAGLLVGASAWGADTSGKVVSGSTVTETFDFNGWGLANVNSKATANIGKASETADHTVGETAVYEVTNPVGNASATLDLFHRFAMSNPGTDRGSFQVLFYNSDKSGNRAYFGGTAVSGYLSILDLPKDATITFEVEGTITFQSSNVKVSGGDAVVVGTTTISAGTTYVVTTAGNVDFSHNTWAGFKKVVISYESSEDIVTNPTLSLTGTNGNNRIITVTDGTSSKGGTVTTYYTTNGEDPTSSSTAVTEGQITVSNSCTIKAISISSEGGQSSIVPLAVEAGTPIVLNSPVISRTNATTVSISAPQSVLGSPSATIYYRVGSTGDFAKYSEDLTVSTTNTVYAYAAASGYDNSTTVSREIKFIANELTQVETVNYQAFETGGLDTENATEGGTKTTYYPMMVDGNQWGSNIYFQNAGWTLRGNNTWLNNGASGSNSWLLIKNLKKDDIVVVRIQEAALATVNATYVEKYSYNGHYAYVANADGNIELRFQRKADKGNNIFSGIDQYITPTFTLASGQAQHLTFHNAGSGSANDDNWKINVYNSGNKVGEVRADWWDDVAAGNGNFTNPYLSSVDGGITGVSTNWTIFLSDSQDADCDFTVSYTGGSLYIIGTMTKGSNIYYVNYTKTGLTGDVAILLYGKNATLTSISFASTDVNTTYAGPSNAISATVTNAGWATLYTPYALDFSGVTGLEAYTAAVSESTVTLTKVNDVPANTGVVLKAAAKTYDIPVIASSETAKGDLEGNATAATAFDAFDGYTLYILTKDGDNDAQFNPMTSGSLAAGKAYLKISNATPARSLKVVFADETTGINSINADAKAEGVYNMNGQRVANPAKGLYIVNGKKVIIK